jgi:hypothetical protein
MTNKDDTAWESTTHIRTTRNSCAGLGDGEEVGVALVADGHDTGKKEKDVSIRSGAKK